METLPQARSLSTPQNLIRQTPSDRQSFSQTSYYTAPPILDFPTGSSSSAGHSTGEDRELAWMWEESRGSFWRRLHTPCTRSCRTTSPWFDQHHLRDAGRGATFPVYILGLAMSADQLQPDARSVHHPCRRQYSARSCCQLTPGRREMFPMSWTMPTWPRRFPDFKIPKPGEPGVLFFPPGQHAAATPSR